MILITGATGTVGSEVVKRLSAQGVQARAVTRELTKWRQIAFHMFNSSKAILIRFTTARVYGREACISVVQLD